jgi:uncharacterized protein involved in cysteine biosynthesis
MNRSKTSNVGLIIFLAATLVALAAYLADLHNLPVLAPWLDLLGRSIYGWMPLLARLLPNGAMYLSAGVVGLAVFLLATIFASPFIGNSTSSDQLERKLKGTTKKNRSGVRVG